MRNTFVAFRLRTGGVALGEHDPPLRLRLPLFVSAVKPFAEQVATPPTSILTSIVEPSMKLTWVA